MKKLVLVGNPNTGKTTLLNALTKSHEHTGNWHGVTVEAKQRFFDFYGQRLSVVDLPGLYSLNPLSFEEKISVDYLENNPHDIILNICDLSVLRKNLYLTLDLLLSGKQNLVIVINTMGNRPSNRIKKNIGQLGKKVLFLNFENKQDIIYLKNFLKEYNFCSCSKDYFSLIFSPKTQREFDCLQKQFGYTKYEILKIVEKNNYFLLKTNKNKSIFNYFSKLNFTFENLVKAKYDFIDGILGKSDFLKQKIHVLDKFFLNRFLAVPMFFLIMLFVFYITFFAIGPIFSNCLSWLIFNVLSPPIINLVDKVSGGVPWVIGLVADGVLGGVGSVFAFLPQVALLFLALSIMEETGYFARVSFVFEDVFSQFGLSGKSVYTLMMGFGCTTSAVLTARGLDSKSAKIKTAIITPYMSCSAKLPIYAVIGGAFFGAFNVWIIFLLYLIGVFCSLLVSLFLGWFLPKEKTHFLMEFPAYKVPKLKKVLGLTIQNMKLFLIKVASVFISVSIIVWCLSNFDLSFNYIGQSANKSILEEIGRLLAPIFLPLGFDNPYIVGALISGLIAKEIVVSSIAIFNGLGSNENGDVSKSLLNPLNPVCFTPASALAFMTFCLLYVPCLASMMVLKKEIGTKWTCVAILLQLFVAYLFSFIVFNIYKLVVFWGVGKVICLCFGLYVVFWAVLKFIETVKSKKTCAFCKYCKF